MNIPINKNIDLMDKNFINRKKPYQLACLLFAFIGSVVVMFVLKPYFSVTIISYICMGISIPLGYLGIYEKNGMDFFTYRRKVKETKMYGKLLYRSDMSFIDTEKKAVTNTNYKKSAKSAKKYKKAVKK